MDKLGIQPKSCPKQVRRSGGGTRRKRKEQQPVRVVHIANPLRVTLSAAEFKDRVQELTGRDSGVADYMFNEKVPSETTTTEEEGEVAVEPCAPTQEASAAEFPQGSVSTASVSEGSGPCKFGADGEASDAFPTAIDPFDGEAVFPPEYGMAQLADLCYGDSFRHFDVA